MNPVPLPPLSTTPDKPLVVGREGRKSTFIAFFGISLAAFAAGFSDCLFDVDKAGACVAHAQSWIEPFRNVGDHLLHWMMAIIRAAF